MSTLAILIVTLSSAASVDVDLRQEWVDRFLPKTDLLVDSTDGLGQHESVLPLLPGEFPLPEGVERARILLEARPRVAAVSGASLDPFLLFDTERATQYILDFQKLDHNSAGRRIRGFLHQSFLHRHCVFRTDAIATLQSSMLEFRSPIEFRLRLAVEAARSGCLELMRDEPLVAVTRDPVITFSELLDDPDHLDQLQRDVSANLGQEYEEYIDNRLTARAVSDLLRAELGDQTLRLTQFRPSNYLDSCGGGLSESLRKMAKSRGVFDPTITEAY